MQGRTVVFDAYGTLFDVTAAARRVAGEPGRAAFAEKADAVARDWRDKQLGYSWLRAAAGAHCDFWEVTEAALDWSLAASGFADDELRARLLGLYRELDAYPEVPATLARLREAGHRTAILSNGSPPMLASAIASAGIGELLDGVFSVEEVGVFKPADAVYALVGRHFGTEPHEVFFVSSNGWDAAFATRFGFETAWVNRSRQPAEHLPWNPTHNIFDLATVPELLC